MAAAILHVITRLDRGGTVGVVVPLADAARALGHRTRIVAGRTPDGEALRRERGDLDIVLLPSLVREVRPLADLAALIALRREIRRFRPALVHTHTSKAGALGRLAARAAGVPAVVHTPHGHVFAGYFGPAASRLVLLAERLLAPLADRIIGVSRGEVEANLAAGIGRRGTFRLVPSGIAPPPREPARAAARAALGLAPGERAVAFVGRLEPVKGPDLLVEAFAALAANDPTLRLLVAGEGALRPSLARRLGAAGLADRARFLGWLADPWPVFAAADLLAAPSRQEGLGKSALEALAAGLPVAAAAAGGLATLAAPGRPLFLHRPGDDADLARALRAALARGRRDDPALTSALLREFGMEAMVRRTFAVYREALERRGRR